jgi:hypothetical protein
VKRKQKTKDIEWLKTVNRKRKKPLHLTKEPLFLPFACLELGTWSLLWLSRPFSSLVTIHISTNLVFRLLNLVTGGVGGNLLVIPLCREVRT